MARRSRTPLFLARASYRQRRLSDAARLLPFLGAFLLLLPLLDSPVDGARSIVPDAVYLFAIWGLLILGAALIAPGLGRSDSGADKRPPDDDAERGP